MSIELVQTLKHTLTSHELSEAISILVEERKLRQTGQLLHMKNSLIIGDKVEWFSTRNKKVLYGKVVRTKTKKAIVQQEGTALNWDIPMGMLKKVSMVNE
jgi:hypothetical protein